MLMRVLPRFWTSSVFGLQHPQLLWGSWLRNIRRSKVVWPVQHPQRPSKTDWMRFLRSSWFSPDNHSQWVPCCMGWVPRENAGRSLAKDNARLVYLEWFQYYRSQHLIVVVLVMRFYIDRCCARHFCDFAVSVPCSNATGDSKVTKWIPSEFSCLVIVYPNTSHQITPMIIPSFSLKLFAAIFSRKIKIVFFSMGCSLPQSQKVFTATHDSPSAVPRLGGFAANVESD